MACPHCGCDRRLGGEQMHWPECLELPTEDRAGLIAMSQRWGRVPFVYRLGVFIASPDYSTD